MISRAAVATAADAIDSITPSRGGVTRCTIAPSRSRITPTFSACALERRAGTFGGRVRPHVELRSLEAVHRQDRADLRAVIASVMRELSERYPELQVELAALVVDPLIEVDFIRLEELLDRIANAGEPRGNLLERCSELDKGLRDEPIGV